jgi:hypothetical protein
MPSGNFLCKLLHSQEMAMLTGVLYTLLHLCSVNKIIKQTVVVISQHVTIFFTPENTNTITIVL